MSTRVIGSLESTYILHPTSYSKGLMPLLEYLAALPIKEWRFKLLVKERNRTAQRRRQIVANSIARIEQQEQEANEQAHGIQRNSKDC